MDSEQQQGTTEQRFIATEERELAEQRVTHAEEGAVRTSLVVELLRGAFDGVRELHVENGYAPKLRAIFRS